VIRPRPSPGRARRTGVALPCANWKAVRCSRPAPAAAATRQHAQFRERFDRRAPWAPAAGRRPAAARRLPQYLVCYRSAAPRRRSTHQSPGGEGSACTPTARLCSALPGVAVGGQEHLNAPLSPAHRTCRWSPAPPPPGPVARANRRRIGAAYWPPPPPVPARRSAAPVAASSSVPSPSAAPVEPAIHGWNSASIGGWPGTSCSWPTPSVTRRPTSVWRSRRVGALGSIAGGA
jgi:hypothetical protein